MRKWGLVRIVVFTLACAVPLGGCGAGSSLDPFALCGNGKLDAGEQCDAGDRTSDSGDCLTTCQKATCGDGFVDVGKEQCDGGNLLSSTCDNLGFAGGTLRCNATCQFDTSGCGAAVTPTTVFTQPPTFTPTPASACGNGVIEPTETCTDCPADCTVRSCTATASTQTYTVTFSIPPAQDVSSITVVVGYRSDVLSLPGSGSVSSVSGRVTNRPAAAFVAVNDLDYALRVVITRSSQIPAGRLVTLDFDTCSGAPAPTLADVACTVDGCATSFGDVEGCSCAVTEP